MDAVDDVKREIDHEYISTLITEYFSSKIFDVVSDLLYKKTDEEAIEPENESENDEPNAAGFFADQYEDYSEQEEDRPRNIHEQQRLKREKDRQTAERKQWEFPNKIGSYQKYVVPALEFSKFISIHIFGLDEAFYKESQTMKVNLLRMIRCKEFSEEVQKGIEPSLILVVPDVICDFCQKCTDLDICRDYKLNQEFENEEEADNWNCKSCDMQLNKQLIQARLLDMVNKRLISYQMQDLKCKQCKMVKNSVVSKYCECTGAFLQTIGNLPPEKLRNQNLLNHMTDIKLFM